MLDLEHSAVEELTSEDRVTDTDLKQLGKLKYQNNNVVFFQYCTHIYMHTVLRLTEMHYLYLMFIVRLFMVYKIGHLYCIAGFSSHRKVSDYKILLHT